MRATCVPSIRRSSRRLLADIILDVTGRGDLVLDPFAGAGSVTIAAEKVGRVSRAD